MSKSKASTAFQVGDVVRVKAGVSDPDFPEFPMGGWTGVISLINGKAPHACLIELDRRTLNGLHPVYRKRCERDGLVYEQVWLLPEDLEPDQGDSPPIEQPTEIVPKPLNMKFWNDRVLWYLGLTSDDPLPEPDRENLMAFQSLLIEKLSFPFSATYLYSPRGTSRKKHSITVIGFSDLDNSPWHEVGLCCLVRRGGERIKLPLTEVKPCTKVPNRKVIEDYTHWYLDQ